ncbi:MEKHLA domain-containing protein [Kiloniella sp.]|uniref:MEKHLA domain-containing protein n=1 Tax=Kiloniella sp. TaxID=1938587 RepID=UPI003B029C30
MIQDIDFHQQHAKRLVESFKLVTGGDLINIPETPSLEPGSKSLAQQLFDASFVVVSHNGGSDPKLNYGNQVALDLWEMSWDDFIGTPSRQTAEVEYREDRAAMLEQARVKGYIDDYEGIRISSSGRRFKIESTIIWAVPAIGNDREGQAATFSKWRYLD